VSAYDPQLEREALSRLARVHGPGEMQATILALIVPNDSVPSFVAWTAETQHCPNAALLRGDVTQLGDPSRLPCFEALLARMRGQPREQRRALLESTRRVMAAITPLRPLDRLHWLVMRRKLGERPPVPGLPGVHNDLRRLPPHTVVRIASVAAYLSRMVPGRDREGALAWYRAAMSHVADTDKVPHCRPPDGDTLARALVDVEALPAMMRPVLLRAWVDEALTVSQRARLWPVAADALRLAALLLESPLPPELARHFTELGWDRHP
jgi:hypothetical protein